VFATLREAREQGVQSVTILGGEPTIHPDFFKVVDEARRLGYEEITIFTNGVRGPQERFWAEILARGRFTWRFSIQGGDRETHDLVVGRPGAFAKIEQSLGLLAERGERITVNLCVTAQSAPSLPRYPALLARYGVREFHIDMVRPHNAGPREPEEILAILPRWHDLALHLREMLLGFRRLAPWIEVNLGNLPYCVLPEAMEHIHHGGEPTFTLTTGSAGALDAVLDKYDAQRQGMVHPPGCAACAERPRCRGVPALYLSRWGAEELVPLRGTVPRAEPARRDVVVPSARLLRAASRLARIDPQESGFETGKVEALAGGLGVRLPWHRAGGPGIDWVLREEGGVISLHAWPLGVTATHAEDLRRAVARVLGLDDGERPGTGARVATRS
jgi:MoaA/NifB/PqqE/SkfB family radical SAM enzyme